MKTSWPRHDFSGFRPLNGRGHGKFMALAALLFLAAVPSERAQIMQGGNATDFTSDQYYQPPNEQLVEMRLSGASAAPLPNGALGITDLKIEHFDKSGKVELIIRAPQCTYKQVEAEASSAGHLEFESGDGKIKTTGDGFLWQQDDKLLTISNHVHTVIKTGLLKLTAP